MTNRSQKQSLFYSINKIRVNIYGFLSRTIKPIRKRINPSLLLAQALDRLKKFDWQEFFSEFLGPKSVVGLQVTDTSIGAVQIYDSIKGVEIDRTAFMELKDQQNLSDELRDFFNEANLKQQSIITGLPISSAVIRQIPLSFENVKKLDKIIKYQMESHIPFPIDNMVVDFLPPAHKKNIFTFGIKKDIISEHLANLSSADLEPSMVGLEELALFFLYKKIKTPNSQQPVAIIHFSHDRRVVMVIVEKNLVFIRILPEEKIGFDQLEDTFKLYHLENPDDGIGEILLTGQFGASEILIKKIRSRLKIKTSIWRPFDELKHKLGKVKTDMQSKLIIPLGLALSLGDQTAKTLDFRKEEFTYKRSMGLKKTLMYAASVILFLISLHTFNTYHKLHVLQNRDSHLKTQIDKVITDDFPEMRIVKGQEKIQYEQKVKAEMVKYGWFDDLTKGGSTLDCLMALTKGIMKFKEIKIESLLIDKEIRLHGTASSFEVVDHLKREFSNSNFFAATKLVDAKMDKKIGAVRFNFALEKK